MKLTEQLQLGSRGRNKLSVSPNQFCIHVFMLSPWWLKETVVKRTVPSSAQLEKQDSHSSDKRQFIAHEETYTLLFKCPVY